MTTGSPIPHAKDDLEPGYRLGRYRIEAPVGRGGMGTVYRAFDETTNRKVALKLLAAGIAPSLRERFLAECEAEANIRHQHVMPVYDRGWLSDDRPYFVMELLYEPINLADLVDAINSGRLASLHPRLRQWNDLKRLIADVILPICDGVHVANHEYGVQHRDLKPDNVLIDIRTRRPYLIDFGICRAMDDGTDRGKIVGTPRFLSPEQARARVDPRTDVWGLGALLHYVVVGEPPLARTSAFTRTELGKRIEALRNAEEVAREAGDDAKARGLQGRRQQLEDPSLRVQEDLLRDAAEGTYLPLPGTTGPRLTAIIRKAMAKEPEQRYATAGELASDLRAWLAGGSVQALQEASSRGAAVDFARRLVDKNVVRGVGALAALLVGLAVGAGLFGQAPPPEDHRAEDLAASFAELERAWKGAASTTPAAAGVVHWLADSRVAALRERQARMAAGADGIGSAPPRPAVAGADPMLGRPNRLRIQGGVPASYEVQDLVGLPPRPANRIDAAGGMLAPGVYRLRSVPHETVHLLLSVTVGEGDGFQGLPQAQRTLRLGRLGRQVPAEMVWVPAGRPAPEDETMLESFLAMRGLVTHERWSEWLDELDDAERAERVPPAGFVRDERDPRRWLVAPGQGNEPVRGVRPADATAYARWRSTVEDLELRLPDEMQWARMAAADRMRDLGAGHTFPWRAAPRWKRLHRRGDADTVPLGARLLQGVSPNGVTGLFDGEGEIVALRAGGFAIKGRGGLLPLVAATRRSEPLAQDARGHRFAFRLVGAP